MPRGLRRLQDSGESHFVTFSCYHRQPYSASAEVFDLFVHCVEDMRRRFELSVYDYVVMPGAPGSRPRFLGRSDPSAALGISAAGSDARWTPQPGRRNIPLCSSTSLLFTISNCPFRFDLPRFRSPAMHGAGNCSTPTAPALELDRGSPDFYADSGA